MTTAYRFDDDFRNMAAAKSAYAARKSAAQGTLPVKSVVEIGCLVCPKRLVVVSRIGMLGNLWFSLRAYELSAN